MTAGRDFCRKNKNNCDKTLLAAPAKQPRLVKLLVALRLAAPSDSGGRGALRHVEVLHKVPKHALLEFLQQRNLEFNTLRKAKHSTAVILYYLHNKNAPGLIPVCSCCKKDIRHLRWHRIKRPTAAQRRRSMSGGFVRPVNVGVVGAAGLAPAPAAAAAAPAVAAAAAAAAPSVAAALPPAVPTSTFDQDGMNTTDLCQSCYAESKSKDDYIPVRITFERST